MPGLVERVEGAKFATVILISIFGAYLFVKRSERKISGFKGTVSETDKKIKELNARTDKALQEIDGLTSAFNNFKNDQEQRYKDIRTELGQYKNGVSKVDTFLQKNQQALSILSKRLENFFFVTCPNCNTRINLDFPNTIISGMHDVDGPASDSTSRDTSEIELQCPQCKRKYHIDIPHTELIKT